MADRYEGRNASVLQSGEDLLPTVFNTDYITDGVVAGLLITEVGTISVETAAGEDRTIDINSSFVVLPVKVKHVNSTGTTISAGKIWGLK